MEQDLTQERKRKRFLYGILLAWIPAIPLAIAVRTLSRGFSEQKATGIGAVIGSLAEGYFISGVILTFIFQAAGIVLLARSFAGGHRLRSVLSVFSIMWSAWIFFLFTLLVWALFHWPSQYPGPIR